MKTNINFLTILLFCFISSVSVADNTNRKIEKELCVAFTKGQVFMQQNQANPFAIMPGKYKLANEIGILTFNNGQIIFNIASQTEVRLKEESLISLKGSDDLLTVRKGKVGFKMETGIVITPHFKLHLQNATVVVKVNPVLSRVCVLKGSVKVEKYDETITLKKDLEIAASALKLSRPYKRTAELRFAWYWVAPEKEPSFQ